jgi:hypothetical protein
MFKLIKTLLSLCVLLILNNTQAQEKNIYMYGEESKPTIFIVCKPAEKDNILGCLNKLAQQNQLKNHYVFITENFTNKEDLSNQINILLNKQIWFDKYQLYLLSVGDSLHQAVYNILDKKVFAETHFQSSNETIDAATLHNIIIKFQKKYLWLLDLERIEEKGKQEVFQKKDWSLGFVLGWNWQNTFTKDSAYLPSFITKYGVLVDYKLSNHWHLNGKLLMSFSIPNQKKLQSEMQSQIDPSKGGVQTISTEINLHVFVQPSLQLNYFFNLQKNWQSFAGIGISATNYTAAHKKISRTVDVSSMGAGGGGGMDAGLSGINDLVMNTGSVTNPFAAFGFSKNLSPNSSFYFSGDFFFINTNNKYKDIKPNYGIQNLSLQTGIMFRIGKKATYTYKYLNN